MKKDALILAILITLLTWPLGAQVAVGVDIRMDPAFVSRPQPALGITGIPAAARSIPINKGDGGNGTLALTVPASSVSLSNSYAMGFSLAPQLTFYNRLTLRGGMLYNFYNKGLFEPDSFSRSAFPGVATDFTTPNFHETNFSGTVTRGTGQSLVYYGIKIRPEATPGLFGEAEIRLTEHIGLVGGYEQNKSRLVLDRGWDRFDVFEDYKQDLFGQLTVIHPYAGLSFFFGNRNQVAVIVTAGPTQNRCKLEAIGGQANCSGKNGFAFSLSIADRFKF